MEAATQQIELVNAMATVQNLLLQMATLSIEAMMQGLRASQAASRVIALGEKVKRLVAYRAAAQQRQASNPGADPAYRVIRDQRAEQALRAGGVKGRDRRQVVDKVAAAVMLQGWLDSRS